MQVNIIITNKIFQKVIFKKKTFISDFYIKDDISSGKLLSQNPSCNLKYLKNWLLKVLAWPRVVLAFSLVVPVYPIVVSVCPLVVPVALSVSLFITDKKMVCSSFCRAAPFVEHFMVSWNKIILNQGVMC